MRITNIRYEHKKNMGNYESETLALEGIIEEGEAPGDAVESLKCLVEYKLNYEERNQLFKRYSKELSAADDARKAALEVWFEKYKSWKLRAEAASRGDVI